MLGLAALAAIGPTSADSEPAAAAALLAVDLVAGVSAFVGAWARRRENSGWLLLAIAVVSYATNAYVYAIEPSIGKSFPSLLDATLVVFYPLTIAALVLLVRGRFPWFGPVRWLDTAISGLALAAIGALVLRTTLPGPLDTIVIGQLAYAIGDLILLGFLSAVYLLSGRRSTAGFGPLGLGVALLVVADVIHVNDIGAGATASSAVTNLAWPAGILLLGLTATGPWPRFEAARRPHGRPAIPLLAAVACLPIAMFATTDRPFALTLAGLSLLTVIVRLYVSMGETARLTRALETELTARADAFERQRAILATAYDAFVAIDQNQCITDWNPSAEALFGWPAESVRGRPLAETIIPERYREAHRAGFERYLSSGEAHVLGQPLRLSALRRDGSEVPVEVTITAIQQKDQLTFAAFLKDLTNDRRAERYSDVRVRTAGVLTDAPSLQAAGPAVLEALGEGLGFDYTELLVTGADGERLHPLAHWHSSELDAAALLTRSPSLELRVGEGLPRRVWSSPDPLWIPNLALTEPFPRLRQAVAAGLTTGVVISLRTDNAPLGVLVLLSREARTEPEPGLLAVVAELGSQLTTFIERRRSEDLVREQAEDLATVTRAVHDIARASDAASARPAICQAALRISGAAAALLHEPDRDGRALVQSASAGLPLPGVRLELAGKPSGTVKAFLSGKATFYPDAVGHPDLSQSLVEATAARSAFFQPIVSGGRPIAVLALVWREALSELPRRLASVMNLLAAEVDAAIQRADLLARLESVARTDDLTGLLNRRAWNEELPREFARASRERRPLCVALVDLDRFKVFNDEHGHQAGDRLLKEAAAGWRNQLRATDVIARYGGEEFAVALPATTLEQAVETLERLRSATPQSQTCSIGVASWDGEETPDALTHRADVALYAAKQTGRDRVVVAEGRPSLDRLR